MYAVSARFLASLAGVPRWQRLVEWSDDGLSWQQVTLHSGTVTQDATSQVRWSLSADISGVTIGRDGLSPYGSLMRARVGMVHGPGDVEWVPLGVFRVDRVRTKRGSLVTTVTGSSLEAAIISAEYPAATIIDPLTSSQVIAKVIQEVVPSMSLSWRMATDPPQPRITTGTSRWAVIDGSDSDPSVAKAIGAQCFTDRNGQFVVAPVSQFTDLPVWTVDEGLGGVLIESTEELTREGVYNVVAVTGESTSADTPPVGPGIASDLDPASATYAVGDPARGGFGVSVFHYSSPLLTTMVACQNAALSMLAPRLGLRQQIEFSAATNPALDAGDVILVRASSGLMTPTILDSVEIDLDTMTQTSKCRAGATRTVGVTSGLATTTTVVDDQGSSA